MTTTVTWAQLTALGLDAPGTYPIALRVYSTDSTVTAYSTLTIDSTAPTLTVTPAPTGTATAGVPYTINFSGQEVPGANYGITGWTVNWGDGSTTDMLPSDATSDTHVYTTENTYPITVTATDPYGSYQIGTSVTVAVGTQSVNSGGGPNGSGYTITAGQSLVLTATAPGSPVDFYWDLNGPGQEAVGVTTSATGGFATSQITLTWAQLQALGIDEGTYDDVTVEVVYADGSSATSAPTTLTVDPAPPTATFTGTNALLGGSSTVSFSNPYDPSAAERQAGYTYSYDFFDNGIFEIAGSTSPTAAVPASLLAQPGSFVVQGQITAQDGQSTDYTTTIVVGDVAPTVSVGPNQTISPGTLFTLSSATTFSDPGYNTAAGSWPYTATINCGDGTTSVGALTVTQGQAGVPTTGTVSGSHLYLPNQTDTVIVTVEDSEGIKGSASFQVTVGKPAVTVVAGPNQTAAAGAVVSLTQTTFTDNAAPDLDTATINWGDGSAPQTVPASALGEPATPGDPGTVAGSHVYGYPGSYAVTVSVTDGFGASNSNSFQVNVTDAAPVVAAANLHQSPGVPVALSATFSDPGFSGNSSTETYTATVNWGDGTASSPDITSATLVVTQGAPGLPTIGTISGSHTYAAHGNYPVTITVLDNLGQAGSTTVTALDTPPTVVAGGDQTGSLGTPVIVGATFTDPGYESGASATSYTATINWGDGTASNPDITTGTITVTPGGPGVPTTGTISGSHIYSDQGSYTVTVSAIDDSGGIGQGSFTATVHDPGPTLQQPLPSAVFVVGQVTTLQESFTEPGINDQDTVTVNWGDGTASNPDITQIAAGSTYRDANGVVHPSIVEPTATTPGLITVAHAYNNASPHTVTLTVTDKDGVSASVPLQVYQPVIATTTTVTVTASSANPSDYGQAVTFTATVSASPQGLGLGTPTGTVTFYDNGTSIGTGALNTAGIASLPTSHLLPGNQTITVSYSGAGLFLASSSTTNPGVTEHILPLFDILNPSASGALTVSGNASINTLGLVAVDSSSSSALTLNGGSQLTAGAIEVVGGASLSNNSTVSPKPTTGAAAIPDPLASLPVPTAGTSLGSVTVASNSALTINPGLYTAINVLGNATLTLNPGIYEIAGGGFNVGGNATVTGSGVLIYNAGSNCPALGGQFGGINFSGNVQLSAATSGPYAGIVIFQSRDNSQPISLSGNATQLGGGIIYAPAALVSLSGGDQLTQVSLVVNELDLTGGSSLSDFNQAATTTTVCAVPTVSVYGQSVTFTATVAAACGSNGTPAPTGTVTFYEGSTPLGPPVALSTSGGVTTATLTTSSLGVSSCQTITAVYSGDSNDLPSTGCTSETVNQASTSTTVSASADPTDFGQAITFTASVAVNSPGSGTPTGTVAFVDTATGDTLGTAGLTTAGTASLTTAALPPGNQTITAIYNGDGNFCTSTSAGLTETIIRSIDVLNASASGALQLTGGKITTPGLVAVDSSSSSALVASGGAQVQAGVIQVVGGVSLSGGSTLTPGAITGAVAVPDPLAALAAPTAGSSRGAVNLSGNSSQTINPGLYTAINVSGNATLTLNPGIYEIAGGGFNVSGSATVTGNGVLIYNAGSKYPTTGGSFGAINLSSQGTVQLTAASSGAYAGIVLFQSRDNTQTLTFNGSTAQLSGIIYAPAALLSLSGSEQLSQATLVVNTLQLTGGSLTTNPNMVASITTVSASPTAPVYGQIVTFTATVTAASGNVTPAGSVTFYDGKTPLGQAILVPTGTSGVATATFATAGLSVSTTASHLITAVYSGDNTFLASTGTLTEKVNQAATTTTVTSSSADPSVYGQLVTFTATVTATAPGSTINAEPTGTVTFSDGTTTLGTGTLNAAGVATYTTTAFQLPVGSSQSITTSYASDGNYAGSTSAPISQTVNTDPTTTVTASSANPSDYGQPVTFTATVTASAPGTGTPTGTVTFKDGSTTLGTGTLNGSGMATFTTSAFQLPVGSSQSITASYASDGNYASSTSSAFSQTVQKDNTTTADSSSSTTSDFGQALSDFGQALTFTATVTASAPGTGTPTGSVTFVDTTTGNTLGTVGLTAGTASLTTAALPPGTQTITVSYSGDSNFNTSSTSAGTTVVIIRSIDILNPSASGALQVNSGGTITTAGLIEVDSCSSSAFTASSGTQVTAGAIEVVGGTSISSKATVSPKPVTGAASFSDPLAALPVPAAGTSLGSVNLGGNSSLTINPGLYAGINVEGNATLTLNPGIYEIAGGGLQVGNNATLKGTGVLIYNAGSNCPGPGGSFGAIDFDNSSTIQLSPPTTGTYAGVVIFQSRDDSQTLSFGCTTVQLGGGIVYAPAATLSEGGGDPLTQTALVVNELQVSGTVNTNSTQTATTTTVTAAPSSSVYGQGITFTATVAGSGSVAPTGTVTFFDNGAQLGQPVAVVTTSGVTTATLNAAALTVSAGQSIKAFYNGDNNFLPSTGTTTETVTTDPTTTTIATSANPSVLGQSVTFTATVTAKAPGSGTPTGTVTFYDGTAPLGTGTLSASGVATYTTSALPVGSSQSITASYASDGHYASSTSAAFNEPVSTDPTTTTVTASSNPSIYGQAVTYTATVIANAPGSGIPSGTVTFYDGTTSLGTGTLNASGVATYKASAFQLPVGSGQSITASYPGGGNYARSTSASFSQTVNADPTTTVTASSANPSVYGQAVTFTATVTASAPGSGTLRP